MIHELKAALFLARHPSNLPGAFITKVMSQRRLREALYHYVDWRDRGILMQAEPICVPPAALRFRVHGDLSVRSFLESGGQCSQDLKDALAKVGKDINSFQRILDFGCGCGRTLIGLANIVQPSTLFGTDIDAEAIEWCRHHLHFASFETNDPLPPLNHPADTFDLIYAISVFTHLNEDYQFAWLSELERVTKSKGYVLLTVHGAYYWDKIPPSKVEEVKRTGLLFMSGSKSMQGIFPDWYQTAFHTQEYVLSNYSKYFDVLAYIPSGMDNCQDIVVLQKA